ncbi:MAG: tyrB [Firmicutes bacterium]|nr:tyrB [Bacillota bacterium]
MIDHVAALHMRDKVAEDKIFGASAAAKAAVAKYGKEKVVDATIGVILDDNEALVSLSTVEKVYRNLPMSEITSYAPIAGLPDYLDSVIDVAFMDSRPEAYIKAIATAGGSGAIHHAIWNYTETGDTVLTTDWYWDPYQVMADALMRNIDTFTMFDEKQKFNTMAFQTKVQELQAKQNNVLIILNTPAHNPVGYSLDDNEWGGVLEVLKNCAKNKDKNVILFVDIAYVAYAGNQHDCRSFMKKFSGLPENVLVLVAYSMSKGYTLYGQRTGAIIGVSSSRRVIDEFESVNQYLCRATWSNINRSAMKVLTTIHKDKALTDELDRERDYFYKMIHERAKVFTAESQAANLKIMPYIAGFFLSVPASNPDAVCEKLYEDNIFAVPLTKGIRVAVCAVPLEKVKGMAAKMAKAKDLVEK